MGPGALGAVLAVVGAIWALWTVARVAWWVYTRTCRRRLGIAARYAAQGRPAWALVTGASRGIGFAFCEELADEGFDVVMVARTREPLEAAARTIRDRYGVDAVALPADLADAAGSGDASRALESRITEAFSTRDISLVVCNAGITAREVPGAFHRTPSSRIRTALAVNCGGTTLVAKLALAHMASRGGGAARGGLIILSSVASSMPAPGLTCYAATKAFDLHLARACAAEYAGRNLDILAVTPGFVATSMSGFTAPARCAFPPVVTPRDCAAGTLDMLGHGTCVTGGHWLHDIQIALASVAPRALVQAEALSSMEDFRQRILQRQEESATESVAPALGGEEFDEKKGLVADRGSLDATELIDMDAGE